MSTRRKFLATLLAVPASLCMARKQQPTMLKTHFECGKMLPIATEEYRCRIASEIKTYELKAHQWMIRRVDGRWVIFDDN